MEDLFEQVGSALRGPQLHLRVSCQMNFDRNLFPKLDGHGPNKREMSPIEPVGEPKQRSEDLDHTL